MQQCIKDNTMLEVKGTFDAAHRLVNVESKCKNIHGHTYEYTIYFAYDRVGEQGYAIDFSVLKDVVKGFIDVKLDHGYIANPSDSEIIALCATNGWKCYLMNFGYHKKHKQYTFLNPTVENIAKMIAYYVGMELHGKLARGEVKDYPPHSHVRLHSIHLKETPTCATTYVFNYNDLLP